MASGGSSPQPGSPAAATADEEAKTTEYIESLILFLEEKSRDMISRGIPPVIDALVQELRNSISS